MGTKSLEDVTARLQDKKERIKVKVQIKIPIINFKIRNKLLFKDSNP
jgi:hypothetical protein